MRFAFRFGDRLKSARMNFQFHLYFIATMQWKRVLNSVLFGFRIGLAPSVTSCFAAKRGIYDQG